MDDNTFNHLLLRLIDNNNNNKNENDDLIILYNLTKSNEIRDYNWNTSKIYNNTITYNIYNIILILITKYWKKILLNDSKFTKNDNNIFLNNEKLLLKILILIQKLPEYDNDIVLNSCIFILNDDFVDMLLQRLVLILLFYYYFI